MSPFLVFELHTEADLTRRTEQVTTGLLTQSTTRTESVIVVAVGGGLR